MALMRIGHARHPRPAPRGFTLVEAMFSMGIVGFVLVASLSVLGAARRLHEARLARETATMLAHDLMGEILQAHYLDPENAAAETAGYGPETDEIGDPATRAAFDDVDDYDGWTETPPASKAGVPLDEATGFRRSVTVEIVPRSDPTAVGRRDPALDEGLKRITVEARREAGVVVTLVALRAAGGSIDREPETEATFVRWIGVRLQLGADAAPLSSGTTVLNQIALGDGS